MPPICPERLDPVSCGQALPRMSLVPKAPMGCLSSFGVGPPQNGVRLCFGFPITEKGGYLSPQGAGAPLHLPHELDERVPSDGSAGAF